MTPVVETLEENDGAEKMHGNSEEISSDEESEEVDNDLLIDTIVAENRREQMGVVESQSPETLSYDKIMVNSMQIIPSPSANKHFTSYLEAVVGQPVVTELAPDDMSCQQNPSMYSVQSPDTSGGECGCYPYPTCGGRSANQVEPEDSWCQYGTHGRSS